MTPALAVTASGRYNLAEIDLVDHLGSNLTGNTRYGRFNPAIGATYKFGDRLTAYAGYSEGNRAPTPSEIECSNPAQPCLLPSSLSSDPPNLKQVVSHTYEAGLRGDFQLPAVVPGQVQLEFRAVPHRSRRRHLWRRHLDQLRAFSRISARPAGKGSRPGSPTRTKAGRSFVNYSLVDATFQSPLTLPSPSNPFADANGNIQVTPGDRLPGIPLHQLKAGADYRSTGNGRSARVLTYFSDQYLRGDESNQNPPLPGYAVVNLHTTYTITDHIELFANVQNLFNANYATFAQYGDPTGVGAPGVPTNGIGVDNRFLAPGAPIAVYGGVKVKF